MSAAPVCNFCGEKPAEASSVLLLQGSAVAICPACVAACRQAQEKYEPTAIGDRRKCSFCNLLQKQCQEAFHPGQGVWICHYCLELCGQLLEHDDDNRQMINCVDGSKRMLLLENSPSASEAESQGGEDHCGRPDCVHCHRESSAKDIEWMAIENCTETDFDLLKVGSTWVRRNIGSETAGKALLRLLAIKPGKALITLAKKWLDNFPDGYYAADLLGVLISVAPDENIESRVAAMLACCREPADLHGLLHPLLKTSLSPELQQKLLELLERSADHFDWPGNLVLAGSGDSAFLRNFRKRFVELNLDNPEIWVVVIGPMEPLCLRFEWCRRGGRHCEHTPLVLRELWNCYEREGPEELPRLVQFAHEWLELNAEAATCAHVYQMLILRSGLVADVQSAKHWYEMHQRARYAWMVPCALLEVAYRDEFAPEPWAVERASSFLRQHKPSSYISLVAALVGAAADAENIAWARKVIGSTGRLGVLARLIKVAPEPAFIAQAERFVDYWCNTELAPEMICAMLEAEPDNALARAQGRRFLAGIRCREHKLYGTLRKLLLESDG